MNLEDTMLPLDVNIRAKCIAGTVGLWKTADSTRFGVLKCTFSLISETGCHCDVLAAFCKSCSVVMIWLPLGAENITEWGGARNAFSFRENGV
jgi:hypothetical protein